MFAVSPVSVKLVTPGPTEGRGVKPLPLFRSILTPSSLALLSVQISFSDVWDTGCTARFVGAAGASGGATGSTRRIAVCVPPWDVTVIATGDVLVTPAVGIGNCADVAPAGTVTLLDGPARFGVSLTTDTTHPLAGAGPLRVTVPWTGCPP